MAQSTKTYRAYGQEQLKEVQKLLRQLPEKDARRTRQEAAEFLKEDFHKALSKGYSPKELAAYLKEKNQPISVQLIEDAVKCAVWGNAPRKSATKSKDAASAPNERSPIAYPMNEGGFEIIPDRPDGEL